MSLYDLTGKIKCLYDMAEDEEIDEDTLRDTLEAVEGEFDVKCANVGRLIRSLDTDASSLATEANRLMTKKMTIEKRSRWFKEYLMQNMQTVGKKQAGDAVTTIKIQKNGGKLPLIIDKDVPKTYQKKVMRVDNEKIREALDSGKKLAFAHYGERGESLRIK